ncbi:MAG: Hsp20/alpha crystallin family protein [Haloferacaceae archaeon]
MGSTPPEITMIDRRNPFRDIERMFEQLSEQFDESARWWEGERPTSFAGSMSVDVADQAEAFVVTADLPGFEKDEIDVTISNSVLEIAAEHESETETREEDYLRQERTSSSMSRSLRLPEPVREDDVSAKYKNGVLTVTLPKTEPKEEGRDIEIE